MHGFKRTDDDETERIIKDRKTDERGSLDKGAIDSAWEGDDEACWNRLLVGVGASEDLALRVPLTNRGFAPDDALMPSLRKA